MRVALVEAENDLLALRGAIRANALRCDPNQPAAPEPEELVEFDGEVVAVYDDAGKPVIFALERGGRILWLCMVNPSREAAVLLAEWIFNKEGSCEGTVVNPDVRALFDDPHIWLGPSGVYLEWRP